MSGTASQGSLGAGQQDPNDSASEVNQIAFAVRQIIAELDTMKLVQVKAVHPGSGSPPGPTTVDVLPLVQQVDGNGNAVSHEVVHGIPVKRAQGGPWMIVIDPAVGDVGYVTAADRDGSKVVATGAQAPPGSGRSFSISDGVYEGGCLNKATEAYLWLKADGTFVLNDKSGNKIATTTTGMTMTDANGNQMQMKTGAVNFVTPQLQVNGIPVTVP
jgi:hypothetical protein